MGLDFSNFKDKEKKIISYLKLEGEDSIYTAMAKTVGLPIAILIEHIIISNKIECFSMFFCRKIFFRSGQIKS